VHNVVDSSVCKVCTSFLLKHPLSIMSPILEEMTMKEIVAHGYVISCIDCIWNIHDQIQEDFHKS
jgi:hypothetical protein